MVTENDEMVIGWPLGLSFLNIRLRVVEASSMKPYQLHMPSTSFSSFSTSNLDTESTASFFKDNSVSLAQLIGFRSGDRERMYFPNSLRFEERNKKLEKGSCSHDSKVQGRDMSRVICIPVLLDTLLKIRNSKKSSRNKDDMSNTFETRNS
ncbi:hypothetical protein MtrunA17_Chr2g0282681 [Medicago truncatula]|uniref:Uncharacterized protein n=1 Tax=Medicago truncatula TaxID=3880 RepID=A0A396J1U2_MEDTR|nr:uncharacterized protein LOC11446067 isoform X2 [Medicago truncatula]RHN71976.1 hypothetical protein MtrunA17_Chr2g0282681 [Medicago truncatula]